jgi:hypothetical protein
MFVRWKQYQGKPSVHGCDPDPVTKAWTRWEHFPGITYKAYVVEAVRVEGTPRQRVVAYLDSIKDWQIAHPNPTRRVYFWQAVRSVLDRLALDPDARQRCEAQIARVVPPPTTDEEAAEQQRVAGALASVRAFR